LITAKINFFESSFYDKFLNKNIDRVILAIASAVTYHAREVNTQKIVGI